MTDIEIQIHDALTAYCGGNDTVYYVSFDDNPYTEKINDDSTFFLRMMDVLEGRGRFKVDVGIDYMKEWKRLSSSEHIETKLHAVHSAMLPHNKIYTAVINDIKKDVEVSVYFRNSMEEAIHDAMIEFNKQLREHKDENKN